MHFIVFLLHFLVHALISDDEIYLFQVIFCSQIPPDNILLCKKRMLRVYEEADDE